MPENPEKKIEQDQLEEIVGGRQARRSKRDLRDTDVQPTMQSSDPDAEELPDPPFQT